MTKKDILIFLNIFITNMKGIFKHKILKIFSEEICNMLSESHGTSEFFVRFNQYRLACSERELYQGFFNYLQRINKVLDKVDYKLYR